MTRTIRYTFSYLCLFFYLVFPCFIYSQEKSELKEIFVEAESYFLFEEYNEALPLYLQLNEKQPSNDNINYRIGICYLNIPYEKSKSISFLEKAIKNITNDYKEGSFKETKAPQDVYFYLGNAYRINDNLDKALYNYNKFLKLLDEEIYDIDLVKEQIKACENAKKLIKSPIYLKSINLGNKINTRFADINPVVSHNESVMIFTSKLQFYDAVFFSKKIDGEWSFPINLMFDFGVDGDCLPTSISNDGTELYIYRNDGFIGNIYVSYYVDEKWTPIKKLNENINTKYWESHACISSDGKTLYFTSNRKEGYGGLDIYISERNEVTDEWGPAKNIGPVINTRYNDNTPFITDDGKTLYFSSYGHHNMGGYDIFYSTKLDNNKWSAPLNMRYPINSTDDDLFFVPVQNGIYAYYSKFEPEGYGKKDIYRLEIFSEDHPRKFEIKGIVSTKNNIKIPNENIKISLFDISNYDTIGVIHPDKESNQYTFTTISGDYRLIIESDGYKQIIEKIIIPEDYLHSEITLSTELIPEPHKPSLEISDKEEVSLIEIEEKVYHVDSYKPLKIKLKLEKDSELFVEIYTDSTLINSEKFKIEKKRFTYTYEPFKGKNIIKFKLVDKNNNVDNEEVEIYYYPKEDIVTEKEYETETEKTIENKLIVFLDDLIKLSEGNLKTVLINLDLKAEGITTIPELIQYLKNQTQFYDYTVEDVNTLVLSLISRNQVLNFKTRLIKLAEGDLKLVLEKLDIDAEGITSIREIIKYLETQAQYNDYSKEDIIPFVLTLIAPENLEKFQLSLVQLAKGNLKTFLEGLDLEKEKINSIAELLNYLEKQAQYQDYTKEDLLSLLLVFITQEEIKEIFFRLTQHAEGNLKTVLEKLNLSVEGITSLSDLLNYLLDQAQYNDYTPEDVISLFLKLALQTQEDLIKISKKISPTDDSKGKKASYGLYYLLIVFIMVILIVAFIQRKKFIGKK